MASSRKPKTDKKKAKVKDLKPKNAQGVKGGVNIERPRPIYKSL